MKTEKSGFTLIELLLTIGLIVFVILISIVAIALAVKVLF